MDKWVAVSSGVGGEGKTTIAPSGDYNFKVNAANPLALDLEIKDGSGSGALVKNFRVGSSVENLLVQYMDVAKAQIDLKDVDSVQVLKLLKLPAKLQLHEINLVSGFHVVKARDSSGAGSWFVFLFDSAYGLLTNSASPLDQLLFFHPDTTKSQVFFVSDQTVKEKLQTIPGIKRARPELFSALVESL